MMITWTIFSGSMPFGSSRIREILLRCHLGTRRCIVSPFWAAITSACSSRQGNFLCWSSRRKLWIPRTFSAAARTNHSIRYKSINRAARLTFKNPSQNGLVKTVQDNMPGSASKNLYLNLRSCGIGISKSWEASLLINLRSLLSIGR